MTASTRAAALLIALPLCLLAGCTTTRSFTPRPREPLGLTPEGPFRSYHIEVSYIDQDEIGTPKSFLDIRATVRTGSYGGKAYCIWESYEQREYRAGAEPPAWKAYGPAEGFEYLMTPAEEEPDYLGNLPNLDSIPRDLTGMYFYINMIDLTMWDLYTNLFLRTPEVFPEMTQEPLRTVGDSMTVDLRDLPIALLEWENVSSDLTMTAGVIHAEYLGWSEVGGTTTTVIAFDQAQTLKQNVWGLGMKMPYEGTNRFIGTMHLDENQRLVRGSYREFVYSRVKAPMSQVVIVHSERRYRIELVPEGDTP